MSSRKTRVALLLSGLILFIGSTTAQVRLGVQFFDKSLYSTESAIMVRVTISNDSPEVYRFRLADERRRSIRFDVRSLSNRALPASATWLRAMANNAPAYYRELSLLPGEEYSFVENLRDYIAIEDPGTYLLQCRFAPELLGINQGRELASNTLTLAVRPGLTAPSVAEQFAAGTPELLRAERIPPDEVVRRTIVARQKSLWNEFFLYLDVEALLRNNPDRKRVYDRSSDDARRRMISEFKAELMQGVVDNDIVVIPSSFEIRETRYGSVRGTVQVMKRFAYDGFALVKLYIYELEKRDDIWNIVAYSVENKGSE